MCVLKVRIRVLVKPKYGFESCFQMRVLNVCFQNLNTGFSETRIRLLTFSPNAGPKCVFWKPEYGFCIKSKYSFLNNPNKGLKTLYKGFTKPAYGLWISPKYRFYKNSNTDFVKTQIRCYWSQMCVSEMRLLFCQNVCFENPNMGFAKPV